MTKPKTRCVLWCLAGVALFSVASGFTTDALSVAITPFNPIVSGTSIAPFQSAQAKPKTTPLALNSKGLQIVNPATGATRSLPFGMKEADVVTIVNNVQGKILTRGTNQECGAGPLGYTRWGNGLTLWFNKGVFAGWYVDGRVPNAKKLTTIAGIGTGATRNQLNKAYTVKVQQTSLGTEFSAGGFGGILTGTRPTDTISTLWSGTTCLFR